MNVGYTTKSNKVFRYFKIAGLHHCKHLDIPEDIKFIHYPPSSILELWEDREDLDAIIGLRFNAKKTIKSIVNSEIKRELPPTITIKEENEMLVSVRFIWDVWANSF